ncbi:MAG: S-layer homology domain-containing protein [Candidatus Peregrinibacteria bacterium]
MKKILTVMSVFLVFGAVGANSVSATAFTDVSEGMLFYNSVDFLKNEGVVVGYSDGSFGYQSNINRAELLKIVVEARFFDEGTESLEPYSTQSCFGDVKAGEWYTKYICYAKEMHWIQGYSDGTFKPAQNINFVEAMKIVLEVFGVDYPAGDPWYKGLVQTASAQNLIPLTVDDFGLVISRAEMADMITRKIKADRGELDSFLGDLSAYAVTYESIGANTNVAANVTGVSNGSGSENATNSNSQIVDNKCSVIYNVIGGVYEGFDCGGGVLYDDLDFSMNFQSVFAEMVYVVNDEAIRRGDKFYFVLKTMGGDVAVYNRIVSYDVVKDEVKVLYAEESIEGKLLVLVGIDTTDNLFVTYWQSVDFVPPVCWSPWVDESLVSVGLSGGSSLASYTVPQYKHTEQQNLVNTCWTSL